MGPYEQDYCSLVQTILEQGEQRQTRNNTTRAIFGHSMKIDMSDTFPLLQGRKMFYKGVFGELAAMLRGPKSVNDFKAQGCNYWDAWGDANGAINVDYGNAWVDYNGVNQLSDLLHLLKVDPTSRRLMITGWRPDHIDELSLPCCHHTYQWYVSEGKYLDMLWMQRSVDVMVGLPADVILAAAWNLAIAKEAGLQPRYLNFSFGDCHIYEPHIPQTEEYLEAATYIKPLLFPSWEWWGAAQQLVKEFTFFDIKILNYESQPAIKFEVFV